jgi:NAD(P)-dependent dehydrogenase (short-subunit alcohol dehydrogenase family)
MCDASFMTELVERIGSLEIAALIHTAGVAPHIAAAERMFDVNLDATLRLLEVARPRMANGGAAMLVALVARHLPVSPEAQAAFEQRIMPEGSSSIRHFASDSKAAYLLSKRAIIATVKREAKAFAQRNARIVSVSPGLIDTAVTQDLAEPASEGTVNNAAIQRLGRPDEVAAACVFLCSSSASYITGRDLRVDGGALAGLGI